MRQRQLLARALLLVAALAPSAAAAEIEGVFARDAFGPATRAPLGGADRPEGSAVGAESVEGTHVAWAGRWERLELEVRGPAGAPLLVVASPVDLENPGATLGSAQLVPLVDARRDPRAQLDGAGLYRGRWWIPDRFPLGSRIHVRAYALEASGARALGRDLRLEVVDMWTFEGLASPDPDAAAGWSGWTPVGPAAAARARALTSGEHRAALSMELEAELRWPGNALGERRFFAAASKNPWPGAEAPSGALEWLGLALARGQFAASGVTGGADAAVPMRLQVHVTTGAEGALWVAVGTSPPDGRIERLRVVLRRAQ